MHILTCAFLVGFYAYSFFLFDFMQSHVKIQNFSVNYENMLAMAWLVIVVFLLVDILVFVPRLDIVSSMSIRSV